MSGMSAILSTMGKATPLPVLSLLGAFIVDGDMIAPNKASLLWRGDGTTESSTSDDPPVQLNPATDWITPRSGVGIDLSNYEVQVTATGDPITGSPLNVWLTAEADYRWDLESNDPVANSPLTVTVREKLDNGNSASNTYTLEIVNV